MGKPTCRHGQVSERKGTRGTETSKYPEEEKENLSISKVAASEMEEAQTDIVTAISGL